MNQIVTIANAEFLPIDAASSTVKAAHRDSSLLRRLTMTVAATAALSLLIGLPTFTAGVQFDFTRLAQTLSPSINASSSEISPQIIQKVSQSLYLILVVNELGTETTVGTAWSFDGSHLATNAHVASQFDKLKPGQKFVARSTVAPYDTVLIEEVTLHPEYAAFSEEWNRRAPSTVDAAGAIEMVNSAGAGYDVALMRVTKGSELAPPLQVADAHTLYEMSAGTNVAYVGFPMENLALGGVNPRAPVPQSRIGYVSAMSDYFLMPATDQNRTLIHTSLPVTGGASGSPMIDASGRVVGLISGMNAFMSEDGRIPNAVNANFGQRADLLSDLIGPDENLRRQSWDEGFASFPSLRDTLPEKLLAQWKETLDFVGEPVQTTHVVLSMNKGEDGEVGANFTKLFSKPGEYMVLAMSKASQDIDITVTRGDEILAEDMLDDWFPSVAVTIKPGQEVRTKLRVHAPVIEDDINASELAQQAEVSEFTLLVWYIPPQQQASL